MYNSQNSKKMKTIQNTIKRSKKIFLIIILSGFTFVALAQGPPPPPGEDGGGNPADSGNQLGGAAHVGGGVIILLTLALAYGGKRFYELRKKEELQA